ncbi:hypothetical protein EBR04_00965 [bacterium]|nr:hypothetical protein [bacterium]
MSRRSTVEPATTGSNQRLPCGSRGASGPLATVMNRSMAGAPSVQPFQEATTTSPLSNSDVN